MFRCLCWSVLVLFVLYTAGVEGGCPYGWKYFQGHCYRRCSYKRNWFDAQFYCRRQGANLVEVENGEEMEWLSNNFRKDLTWFGGTDVSKEGKWMWIASGGRVDYVNWMRGEPSGGNENCMQVHLHYITDHGKPGTWNDAPCEKKYSFICEKCRYNMTLVQGKKNFNIENAV